MDLQFVVVAPVNLNINHKRKAMRKVEYYEIRAEIQNNKNVDVYNLVGVARFHEFSRKREKPVAIIELEDGWVKAVDVDCVRFLG